MLTETALTLAKIGLVILCLALAASAVVSFATGQGSAGVLFLLLAGAVVFLSTQLG